MADNSAQGGKGETGRDRREWRGPDFSIASFEVTEPVWKEDHGEATAVGVVRYRGKSVPYRTFRIILRVNGEDYTEELTDQRGEFSVPIHFAEVGSYLISAEIETIPESRRTWRTLVREAKKERPRVPEDLKVYAHPPRPAKKYYVSIEVFGTDKLSVGGWPLEVKDVEHPDEKMRVQTPKTQPDGSYRFTVDTATPREIFVSVVGTPLDYTLRLPGPTKRELLSPPEVAEPTAEDLQGSFRDIAKRAVARGLEELRKQRQKNRGNRERSGKSD